MLGRREVGKVLGGVALGGSAPWPASMRALAQKADDTLRVTWRDALPNLDFYYNPQRTGFVLQLHVWDGLIYRDPDTYQLRPLLATAWKQVDPTTIDFTLRAGRDVPQRRSVRRRRRRLHDQHRGRRPACRGAEQLPLSAGSGEDRRPAGPGDAATGIPGGDGIHRHGVADLAEDVSRAARPRALRAGAGRHRPVPRDQRRRQRRHRPAALRRLFRRQSEGPAGDPLDPHHRGDGRGQRAGCAAERAGRLDLGLHPRQVRTPSPTRRACRRWSPRRCASPISTWIPPAGPAPTIR